MTSSEITGYINARYGWLSSDEILEVIDIERNPQIDHIVYENGVWNMWDTNGNGYEFRKRDF